MADNDLPDAGDSGMAGAMIAIFANLKTIADAAWGYRAHCIELGFSDQEANEMAVQAHSALMTKIGFGR